MKIIAALHGTILLSATLLLSACTDTGTSLSSSNTTVIDTLSTLQNGPQSLLKTDLKIGSGAEAKAGQQVTVHYTGWLYDAAAADNRGKKFDSSIDRGTPFTFPLGAGRVIKGWDQGVVGMKVGGLRTLTIPAELGYGRRGVGASIPPDAPLLFSVQLLGVE